MSRVLSLLGIVTGLLLTACGTDGDAPPVTGTNACGTVGELAAMECTGLATCGAGAQNFIRVSFCDNCLARADSHVCEAGKCRAIDTTAYGSIFASFSLRQVGSTAQWLAQAAIYPVMADGTRVTCAALMSSCGFVENQAINANASSERVVQSGDVLVAPIAMEAGADRLYFAQFTTERTQGTVLARGCVDGINIAPGERTDIVVELSPP